MGIVVTLQYQRNKKVSEFRETQGKNSSRGTRKYEMTQRNVKITLSGDTWNMGWGIMYLGWAGWGAERSHGICAHFPLFYCTNFPQKAINDNCDRGCEGKLIPKKLSPSG